MVDLTDKLLILVWPLFALLTSVAAAKGLVHVLTGRSSSVTWHALLTSDRTDRAKASRVEGGEHGPGRRVPRRPLKADRPQHRPSATGSAGHASAEHAHAHAHETSGPAGASPPDSMRRENGHRRPDRRRPGLRGPGLWARLAPRSIRGQMTLLVTIMTVFTLLPEGGGCTFWPEPGPSDGDGIPAAPLSRAPRVACRRTAMCDMRCNRVRCDRCNRVRCNRVRCEGAPAASAGSPV
ncbi:hypothetical protein GCM10027612_62380 [Microbispora bryophytorum subsp. camponoti]